MSDELIHRGLRHVRTKEDCNRPERVFAERWEEAQHPPSFLNGGIGTLALLLTSRLEQRKWCPGEYWVAHPDELTQRDAEVAATVVQWLGTNCGFCWLRETLEKCGYTVQEKR